MTIDPEILEEFLVESRENLDRLERELVVLEREPTSAPTLASVFRTIHTIKGTAGFLGLERLQGITHVGENLLSKLRDGELRFTAAMASALLALVDAIRELLDVVEVSHTESDLAYPALIDQLTALQQPPRRATPTSPPVLTAVPPLPPEPPAEPTPVREGEATVRIGVSVLDRLMNLAGELVLARNQLNKLAQTSLEPAFVSTCQRLDRITSELQDRVMKTRMQPIGSAWGKLPRIVRDLAASCGKQVRIEMEGEDTELDRTLIEAIRDPLTHMLRNAVDHGIERPEVRRAAGKPAEGVLRLRAYHDSGQVIVEIADDGGGIATDRVRAKAIQRGIIDAGEAGRMSDSELIDLVFAPGFSTAEQVTNVSGRGVGMDVVKTSIERAGGVVVLRSEVGVGTTVRIKIPLTLAILPVLIVTSGGERYAVPQASLVELVRVDGDRPFEHVQGAEVYRLRGRLLPLVDLARQLGGARSPRVKIVVLQVEGQQFGLVVDAVSDTEEIVVKPLGKHLKGIRELAGATILGDGRVALILDVRGLARSAHALGEAPSGRSPLAAPAPRATPDPQLLFGLGRDGRFALPLSRIARIEEVDPEAVERAGGVEVIQYRGAILPLVRIADVLGVPSMEPIFPLPLQVLVCTGAVRAVGLVVQEVLDVTDEAIALEPVGRRPGVRGTAVLGGRVTELIDVDELLADAPVVAAAGRQGGIAA